MKEWVLMVVFIFNGERVVTTSTKLLTKEACFAIANENPRAACVKWQTESLTPRVDK